MKNTLGPMPSDIPLLLPAAEAGDGQAQFRLAVLYRNEDNLAEARRWARLSAWAGVVEAQLLLAGFLGGEKPDPSAAQSTRELWRAAFLYHRAMEQGSRTGKSRLRHLLGRLAGEWRDFDEVAELEAQVLQERETNAGRSNELNSNFAKDYLEGTPWRMDSSMAGPDEVMKLVLSFRPSGPIPCPLCDGPTEQSSVSRFHWCLEDFPFNHRTNTWVEGDRQWETAWSKVLLAGDLPHFQCPMHGTFPAPMPWTRNKTFYAME